MSEATFQYCPSCGGAALTHQPPREYRCEGCGWHFFFNAAAAAGAILLCNDELMLGVRREDPDAGKLDIIGGFIDFDETAEEGLRRELREELGLAISPEQLTYFCSVPNHYHFDGVLYHTLDIIYTVRFETRPAVAPADDLADVVWMRIEDIEDDQLAFDSTREALRRFAQTR